MLYADLNMLIENIDEPNRGACKRLYEDHKERFDLAPGSFTKHQAWPGGYIDHLEETMNFGRDLFTLMNNTRKLDFSLSDILLVLFLHDLEKPFRYIEMKKEFDSDDDKEKFIEKLIAEYGFVLTETHRNALRYVHGEGEDFSRTERIQKPLAAFVHICDVTSARIWFDYPSRH
jgi:hypothetical protein